MLDTAKHITTVLTHPAILAVVTGGVYWELADQEAEWPFVNFSFQGDKPISKEGKREYNVFVRIFAESLTQGATIAQEIHNNIKSNSNWYDRGNRSGYTDNEAKEAFIELTYNFKL